MGRTQRGRRRKKLLIKHLDHLPDLIELRRWLSKKGWENDNDLKLANFPETGRGVMSSKNLRKNDTIITVPIDLMITYSTLQSSLQGIISSSGGQLEIHDMLTIFLVLEKRKEKSLWREYINSLPQESPALPWLGIAEELILYPADLQIISRKKRKNLEESMYRVKRSIEKHPDCVLDEYLFKWGYVLVNTRAVYIRPDVARDMSRNPLDDVLADEPKMALCPFLDMFNHHFLAVNKVALKSKGRKWFYELKTFSNTSKFNEIFISYGSHDNVKLLMEYGFYLPGNIMDVIQFDLREVLNTLQVNLSERQYKFIKSHGLDKELVIGYDGISFNLKAVFFVSFNEEVMNYNSVVYGDYPADFLGNVPKWGEQLLLYKAQVYKEDYDKLAECSFEKSCHATLMENFLGYRRTLPAELIRNLFQRTED